MERSSYIPKAFWLKKLHSFSGLWLVLFIIEHLVTNSQAALFWGDDGEGFVKMANSIKELPYLKAIEISLIGFPLAIHALWGFVVLRQAKSNVAKGDGKKPSLAFGRNWAYTLQRLTSWILLVGIIAHVIQMRFIDYPFEGIHEGEVRYTVRLAIDKGLYVLANRWHAELYNQSEIDEMEERLSVLKKRDQSTIQDVPKNYDPAIEKQLIKEDYLEKETQWMEALQRRRLKDNEVIASALSFGVASLLAVRDTFKEPWMIGLYAIFVLSAAFHAFNGLWTFLIACGITLTKRSQIIALRVCTFLMIVITFLGFSAILGAYIR